MTCAFCETVTSGTDAAFRERYPDTIIDRAVFRGRRFVIMPTIGQLHPSHVLIITREHVTCIVDHYDDILPEANLVLREMGLEDGMFFEHGIVRGEATNCGVPHAHLHFIVVDPAPVLAKFREHTNAILVSLAELKLRMNSVDEILYVTQDLQSFWLAQKNLESQLVRKIIAQYLGLEWDWKLYGGQSSVLRLINGGDNRDIQRRGEGPGFLHVSEIPKVI